MLEACDFKSCEVHNNMNSITKSNADSKWVELGNGSDYATKASLEVESQKISQLQQEMATKVDETDTLILDCNL